ncbi:MAG: diaminopimelate epimerase [Cytophagales bacterium]
MKLKFSKYQGTGNDFIVIDNRIEDNHLSVNQVSFLCDRRFGIGADGLMLLENVENYDFKMVYFNSDGNESSMCGNGGRCLVRFANDLGIVKDSCVFLAIDGEHHAKITTDKIELKMIDVSKVKRLENDFWLNTGSPHYVKYVKDLEDYPVFEDGRKIRYSGSFMMQNGTNVNFAEKLSNNKLKVRTYERGVEDETLSCGTGVTAVALTALLESQSSGRVEIEVKGGVLEVKANYLGGEKFNDVWLIGPATFVFSGEIELK